MFVDAGGVHTYYEEEGSGEALLLLHGGFGTAEDWANQREAFSERFRVLLPERRGHGRTADIPGRTGYDLMAADTAAFLQALGIAKAHVVGWSDGGIVALELALGRPDLINKLVLIGAPASVDGETEDSHQWVATVTADTFPMFAHEAYDRLTPDGSEHWPVIFNKLIEVWRHEPHHDLSELAAISAPTLIMLSDNEGMTIEYAAAMKRAIPKAQLAVIPGANHFVIEKRPEIVNRLILDFLAED